MNYQGSGLYFFVGHKGEIIFSGYQSDWQKIRQSICEINLSEFFEYIAASNKLIKSNRIINTRYSPEKDLIAFALEKYKKFEKYSSYYDLIVINHIVVNSIGTAVLAFIGELTDFKPTLAADLVLFVKDKSDSLFFVGLRRRYEPGAGRIALIGGYQDVIGAEFEDSLTTVLREAQEEVGLQAERISFIAGPFPQAASVIVKNFSSNSFYHSSIHKVASIHTSDIEINKKTGRKRVHVTTGYYMLLEVPEVLNEESLAKFFRVDPKEAKGLFVNKLIDGSEYLGFLRKFNANNKRDFKSDFEFGIEHHLSIFQSAFYQMLIDEIGSGKHV